MLKIKKWYDSSEWRAAKVAPPLPPDDADPEGNRFLSRQSGKRCSGSKTAQILHQSSCGKTQIVYYWRSCWCKGGRHEQTNGCQEVRRRNHLDFVLVRCKWKDRSLVSSVSCALTLALLWWQADRMNSWSKLQLYAKRGCFAVTKSHAGAYCSVSFGSFVLSLKVSRYRV